MVTRTTVEWVERMATGVARRAARRARAGLLPALTKIVALTVSVTCAASMAGAADLVSVGPGGRAGNNTSSAPATDDTGKLVVFYSDATNLVLGDTNRLRDVFVRDVTAGTTERLSLSSAGQQADGASHGQGMPPGISGDGDVVAFYSDATNLVANDDNDQTDVFVRVRSAATTERVSVASDGSDGDGPSLNPSVSGDGRYVVFQSLASNLVANDTNGSSDIFVRDRLANTTERICDGVQANGDSSTPSVSADGRLVAFASDASNLVAEDTNNASDIFVCDRDTGSITRVSVGPGGLQANCPDSSKAANCSILPAISDDGSVVGFKSIAVNLAADDTNGYVDVFVYDRNAEVTERISVGAGGRNSDAVSFPPTLSADGRWVAFGSLATNLTAGDNMRVANVFVRDRLNGKTLLADIDATGRPGDSSTLDVTPAISNDGSQVVFVSLASNLSGADTNQVADIFVVTSQFFLPGTCPNGLDSECEAGQVCVGGFCVTPTPTPIPTRTPTVTVTGTPTRTPTPTPTFQPCDSDDDCPPGKHCRGGYCKTERPCDDEDPAVDRLACFGDREACIATCAGGPNAGQVCTSDDGCPDSTCVGLCECGGDCDLDGFVYVNEVNRAVKILLGEVQLDRCVAADINGDGSVMGNEVTLAAINLGEGCQQEGQPLLYAHDRGGMVTLVVGTASAQAGGSVTVSVGVSGGEGEVASAQLDLLYDPTVLALDDPTAACAKDPRLTGHVLSASLPADPPAPAGLQRVRLFVGDLTAPIATLSDGGVAACTFRVKGDAGGTSVSLAADRLNVGDARGNVFGSQAVSGGVSILLPPPAAVPGSGSGATCPGDCDGDGEVFVNEITLAVRVLAGVTRLDACPAADADGDGEVFVSDVTRAVLSLGMGCGQ